MATPSDMGETSIAPAEQAVMRHGAFAAAAICLVWLIASLVLAFILYAVGSSVYAAPLIVALGAVAALPVASLMGWLLAPTAIQGRGVIIRMAVIVVLLTDVEISLISSLAAFVMTFNPTAFALLLIGIPYGLLIYGLPGLAVALLSAWSWQKVMRGSFAVPTHQ